MCCCWRQRAICWIESREGKQGCGLIVRNACIAADGRAALSLGASLNDALAQKVTLDLGADAGGAAPQGGGNSVTARIIQLVALLTIIPLAPSILMMVTSFTRIVIVLSLLRTALGLQQTPPNQVLVSLALFLTLFIMAPVFEVAYHDGIAPLIDQKISEREAVEKTGAPFHAFMMKNVREKDLRLFLDMSPGPQGGETGGHAVRGADSRLHDQRAQARF